MLLRSPWPVLNYIGKDGSDIKISALSVRFGSVENKLFSAAEVPLACAELHWQGWDWYQNQCLKCEVWVSGK